LFDEYLGRISGGAGSGGGRSKAFVSGAEIRDPLTGMVKSRLMGF